MNKWENRTMPIMSHDRASGDAEPVIHRGGLQSKRSALARAVSVAVLAGLAAPIQAQIRELESG